MFTPDHTVVLRSYTPSPSFPLTLPCPSCPNPFPGRKALIEGAGLGLWPVGTHYCVFISKWGLADWFNIHVSASYFWPCIVNNIARGRDCEQRGRIFELSVGRKYSRFRGSAFVSSLKMYFSITSDLPSFRAIEPRLQETGIRLGCNIESALSWDFCAI